MTYGVSLRIGRGARLYSTNRGTVAFMLTLAAMAAYVWVFLAAIYVVALAVAVICFIGFFVVKHFMTKHRLSELQALAVSPSSIQVVGRTTNPPTWGVYSIEAFSSGRRTTQYRLGNHPIRHQELTREFGAAELVMLFGTRADAEEVKHLLSTGQARIEAVNGG